MDSVSESNVAAEYRTDADGIRTHAEHLTGEAKEIMLRIADDYDAMARTAHNIFTAKRSLLRLADSRWTAPKPPKHCPANCHAPNATQRAATREQKTGCGIAVTARAWACAACACVYTLEPFGHPRIWLK